MPPISDNNLVLLGLSSGTYAALKLTENRTDDSKKVKSGDTGTPDTSTINDEPAVG